MEAGALAVGVLAQGIVMRVAQQVRPAFGLLHIQRGIGAEEVADHHPIRVGAEQRLRHLAAPTTADDEERHDIVHEDPQPVGNTIDTPAGFITMEGGLLPHQIQQPGVGGAKQGRELGDDARQFAGADDQAEIGAQLMLDLRVSEAEGDLPPRSQRAGRAGQADGAAARW